MLKYNSPRKHVSTKSVTILYLFFTFCNSFLTLYIYPGERVSIICKELLIEIRTDSLGRVCRDFN